MRLIQHKKEAYWFYRFLSLVYDRVNPLFWTEAMRTAALALARLDDRALDTLDVGAGTGFTTEGIVERVDAARVAMLDQSPQQLARSRRRPALAPCRRLLGDAEQLPFAEASFDRYISAGSIIGTALSVGGLYTIAASELPGPAPALSDLWWTLVAALSVNVFIVGLNQLEDVEIDRINKPFLPVASGELSPGRARAIVAVAGLLPVVLAVTQGALELAGVLGALAVGVAYSSPPLRLKRFPTLAAISISGVRSVIVNLVVFMHFSGGEVVAAVWALTLFVLPFSFAIALLKDVPDAEGDRRFHIATFTLRLGAQRTVDIAMVALSAAYLAMAFVGSVAIDGAQPIVLAATQLAALALLWHWRRQADLDDQEAYTRFYLRVWKLFFLEYIAVPLACAV